MPKASRVRCREQCGVKLAVASGGRSSLSLRQSSYEIRANPSDRSFRISTGNSVMPCWLHSLLDRESHLTLRMKRKITIGAINQWEECNASAS